MKLKLSSLILGIAATLVVCPAAERIYENPVPSGRNPAGIAAPRNDWYAMVQEKFDRFSIKPADIIFDGDSITNRWEHTGRAFWSERYAGRAADFGIEGDRVENVMWRLSKGQVDGINPKVVVLMIGTNNTGRNSAEEIADGITILVSQYQKYCPRAHIILMGIFPRGEFPSDGGRMKVAAVNRQIASLHDGKKVTFIDISDKMISADGSISREMMPDFVHPAPEGYRIWADSIQPILDKYCGANKK